MRKTNNRIAPQGTDDGVERGSTRRETRFIPRLTLAEERQVGRVLCRARAAERKLTRRGLPRQERWHLRRTAQAGREARERLVLANLGLVHNLIRRRYRGLMPYEDLVHEGVIGLCVAADRWDGKRRFSTFATWQIRGAMTDAVRDRARLVRLPARQEERAYRLRQIVRDLSGTIGRHPDAAEVARVAGISTEAVEASWRDQRAVLSLDFEDPKTGRPLGEAILVDDDVEGQAARAAGFVNVEAFIAALPEPDWRREAMVLAGLTDEGVPLAARRRTREDLRRYLAEPARAKHLAALAGSLDLAQAVYEERRKGGDDRGDRDK